MKTPPQHVDVELPAADNLLRSTLIALVVAVAILVLAVLPAEYGVDPTGIGRKLGLTQMGEIKVALAKEVAADAAADAAAAAAADAADAADAAGADTADTEIKAGASISLDSAWRHVTIIPLAPGDGKEVKLVMKQGDDAQFVWEAVGGVVNHDTHGDSTGAPNSYVNYRKGTAVSADSGVLVAAMDGSHGWFWRNRSDRQVAVTLRTRGAYAELKKMY